MKLLTKIAYFIASGLGSGRANRAPGTFGSLAFLGIYILQELLFSADLSILMLDILIMLLIGLYSIELCLQTEKNNSHSDPNWIVIDEWIGMAFALLPITGLSFYKEPFLFCWLLLCAFMLFRIFDISKPFPISFAESLPGSFGIIADDLLAGIFSAGILACLM